ncbi:MAG: DNA polymerase III subunit gamma/tau, partial [Candidatus Vogelbacteria bacterium]|nr:DNA polymerase III subunit gamma/tau [Candidatus Vogelbacteria bacterium]
VNQTLYRKYRPTKFSEVIGQEQVVGVLETAISQGNIVHAYLFAGPRGTGKTSVARILAQAIGCTNRDLYEIDGASNRGIDEIRALREAIGTMPFESPYKVYIIDEVHMLTKDAFNALLKTLEEPPANVIFILATTELNKVLETIVSRCQTYIFKKPTTKILSQVASDLAKKEGFKIDQDVADLLAFMGDGSFRDTIGILQKIIGSSADKKISLGEVQGITGAPPLKLVYDLVEAIADNNLDKSLAVIDEVALSSADLKIYLKLVMREIRLALLSTFAPSLKDKILTEASDKEKEFLVGLASRPGAKNLPMALAEFLETYNQIGLAFLPQIPIELALVKILKRE